MFAKYNELKARRARGERGFTLVELLVVVVILAALAAIAVPIFMNQKQKADAAIVKTDLGEAGKMLGMAVSMNVPVTGSGTSTISVHLPNQVVDNSILSSKGIFNVYGWSNNSWSQSDTCVELIPDDPTKSAASWAMHRGFADTPCH